MAKERVDMRWDPELIRRLDAEAERRTAADPDGRKHTRTSVCEDILGAQLPPVGGKPAVKRKPAAKRAAPKRKAKAKAPSRPPRPSKDSRESATPPAVSRAEAFRRALGR